MFQKGSLGRMPPERRTLMAATVQTLDRLLERGILPSVSAEEAAASLQAEGVLTIRQEGRTHVVDGLGLTVRTAGHLSSALYNWRNRAKDRMAGVA